MVPTYSEDETGVVSEGRKGGEDKTKKGAGLYSTTDSTWQQIERRNNHRLRNNIVFETVQKR
jgi:hypothetical protein